MDKTVVIEKEVWESTLNTSMNKTAKCDVLERQLEIAIKALEKIRHTEDWRLAHEALVQINGVDKHNSLITEQKE